MSVRKEGLRPLAVINLPLSNLRRSNYNPNAMTVREYRRLVESMRRLGRSPAAVWARCLGPGDDHGKHLHQIFDGLHRALAALELGFENIDVEVYRVDEPEADLYGHDVNSIRGTPIAFEQARLFAYVLKARGGTPTQLAEDRGMDPEFVTQRLELLKVYHIYEKFGRPINEKVSLGHWQVLAGHWRSPRDDKTLEDGMEFLLGDPMGLSIDGLKRTLAELVRSEQRMSNEVAGKANESEAPKVDGPETTTEHGGKGKKGKEDRKEPASPIKGYTPNSDKVQIIEVPVTYVEKKAWDDPTPPTTSYTVNCNMCADKKQIVLWEEAVTCPGCGKPVVDKKGNIISTLKVLKFRPTKKPFERIYTADKFGDLGIETTLKPSSSVGHDAKRKRGKRRSHERDKAGNAGE